MSGQYVAYTFFRVDPAWRRLPVEERAAHREAFADAIDAFTPRYDHLRVYSTAGVRPETDFFLWKITDRYELLGEVGAALNATPLAGFMHLMLRLRDSEASRYTERDTPIFVGQHMDIREALSRLDGVSSLVEDHD